jgi:hypothetical protein
MITRSYIFTNLMSMFQTPRWQERLLADSTGHEMSVEKVVQIINSDPAAKLLSEGKKKDFAAAVSAPASPEFLKQVVIEFAAQTLGAFWFDVLCRACRTGRNVTLSVNGFPALSEREVNLLREMARSIRLTESELIVLLGEVMEGIRSIYVHDLEKDGVSLEGLGTLFWRRNGSQSYFYLQSQHALAHSP